MKLHDYSAMTLTTAQITELAGVLAGKELGRSADKPTACGRLKAFLNAEIGSQRAEDHLEEICGADTVEEALKIIGKYKAAKDAEDAGETAAYDPSEDPVPTAKPITPDQQDELRERMLEDAEKMPHNTVPAQSKPTEPAKKGRTRSYAGKLIKTSCTENPRREGTHGHKSMQIIINAMPAGISYEDFEAAGGRSKDLKWDIDKGNATATDPQ